MTDPACERPDLALVLPLVHELEPSRRRAVQEHAERCAECRSKLEILDEVEGWLERQIRAPQTGVCPAAEQLYDLGGGPGAQPLSDAELLSVRAHLETCDDCDELVATLERKPPSPLLIDGEIPPPLPSLLRRRLAILAPVAAAAALLAVMLWDGGPSNPTGRFEEEASIRFPSDPVLRGDNSDALWYPRERLLATEDGLWSELRFEIAEQKDATEYRVVLQRHGGGAFDVGEEIEEFRGPERVFASQRALEPGFYTWEAWITVNGLPDQVGSRDFEVVHDREILAALAERDSGAEPARSESILHLLHDSGYLSDARAFARTLPASAGRDEYLNRRPAR